MTKDANTRESSPAPIILRYTDDFINVPGRTIYNTSGFQLGGPPPTYNFAPTVPLNFDNIPGRTVRNATQIPAPANEPEEDDEEDSLAAITITQQPLPLQDTTDAQEAPRTPPNRPPTNGGARPFGSSSRVNIPRNRLSGPPSTPTRRRVRRDDDENKENRPPF